jgi:hypothetical protein
VGDLQAGWNPVAGRKPKILQFASDAQVGTQHTCCVDKYDGDLYDLISRCGRQALQGAVSGQSLASVEAIDFAEAMGGGALLGADALSDVRELSANLATLSPTGVPALALSYDEQRELLALLREHGETLRAMAKPKAGARGRAASTR